MIIDVLIIIQGEMKNNLVSVVVPVYNAEKYLDKCLESLVNQSYEFLEIILVNDGSSDDSGKKCDEWKKKDERIIVIHKGNEGAGCARNSGINKSTGKYLLFVDSDDYLRKDTIKICYEKAEKLSIDFIVFGTVLVDENGKRIYESIPKSTKKIYRDQDVQNSFLPDRICTGKETDANTNLQCSACMACFYNNELIKKTNWHFASEKEVFSEDFYSQLILFKDIKSVFVLEEALYYYRQNSMSLSHNYNRVCDYSKIKYFYEKCLEVKRNNNYSDIVGERLIEPFISYTIVAIKHIVKKDRICIAHNKLKEFVNDKLLVEAIKAKDKTNDSIMRKVLYFSIIHKSILLCYLITKIKE